MAQSLQCEQFAFGLASSCLLAPRASLGRILEHAAAKSDPGFYAAPGPPKNLVLENLHHVASYHLNVGDDW